MFRQQTTQNQEAILKLLSEQRDCKAEEVAALEVLADRAPAIATALFTLQGTVVDAEFVDAENATAVGKALHHLWNAQFKMGVIELRGMDGTIEQLKQAGSGILIPQVGKVPR